MQSYNIIFNNELYHHGILGQKWGIRRYQNEDGTLTEEGKKRYSGKTIAKTAAISLLAPAPIGRNVGMALLSERGSKERDDLRQLTKYASIGTSAMVGLAGTGMAIAKGSPWWGVAMTAGLYAAGGALNVALGEAITKKFLYD